MPALELCDLSKQFRVGWAVNGVTLAIEPQAKLVVLGRSGAGKTTLLRLIAGLETPDRGSVRVSDQPANHLSPHQRELALVSQEFALYPQLTVQGNMLAALAPLKLSRSEQESRITETLGWFHIANLTERLPSELSGGQAQRVALAKAVVRRPKLLLLDEPLSQLDCMLRAELRALLEQVAEHYAMTLVIVTHDSMDALSLATHLAILENGQLAQFGPPASVYAHPTSVIAAELLSPFGINWLSFADQGPSKSPAGLETRAGEQVGFRPEDAHCQLIEQISASERTADDELCLHGRLERMRHLGFSKLLTICTENSQTLHCLSTNCIPLGSQVAVTVAKQDLLRFAPE